MNYDKDARALASFEKELAKLAAKEQKLREARKALARHLNASKSKHEKWHRYKLSYYDSVAGFTGELADARDELRRMPVAKYIQLLQAGCPADVNSVPLIEAELAAVMHHRDPLTAAAKKRYFERDYEVYHEALASWQAAERADPNKSAWRDKPATREQWQIIDRIVAMNGLDSPGKLKRGEAHDWIAANGGNPRYGQAAPAGPDQPRPSSALAATSSEAA